MDSSRNESLDRADKPWLLLHNRRLRHLHGITIRNLSFELDTGRIKGRAIDDEALPTTLRSPAKLLAQRELKKLETSRSSTSLQTLRSPDSTSGSHTEGHDSAKSSETDHKPSPSIAHLRRRSTMDFSDAGAELRRKRYNEDIRSRMADSFFSLHVSGTKEPIYISEVVEKAMNPNFRFFDLRSWDAEVTTQQSLAVKVWAKTETMEDYEFLIELTIDLRSLQYIGKALEHFRQPLPQNCIVFHLTDGIYTSFTDMHAGFPQLPMALPAARTTSSRTQPTSSYDALMKLSTLDDCIRDAIATRDRITSEIESIFSTHRDKFRAVEEVPLAQERLRTVEAAVTAQQRRLDTAKRRHSELASALEKRRAAIRAGRLVQSSIEADMRATQPVISRQRDDTNTRIAAELSGQRRRICEDLLAIFPIEPLPSRPFSFTIRGLHLPNSTSGFTDSANASSTETAAALGHVAHLLKLLLTYMSVTPPYPIHARSSTSAISDPISSSDSLSTAKSTNATTNTAAARTYPLYLKSALRYRFEYAVFLLEKDIEILSSWLGLRLLDIRHTLPNLKYILYVATAGEGEIPARKRGGVRGLLGGGGPSRRLGSRRDSLDSAGASSRDSRESCSGAGGYRSASAAAEAEEVLNKLVFKSQLQKRKSGGATAATGSSPLASASGGVNGSVNGKQNGNGRAHVGNTAHDRAEA